MARDNHLLPWNINHIAKGHVAETQAKNICRIFAMWSKKAKPHTGVSSFPNQYTLNTIANKIDVIMRETDDIHHWTKIDEKHRLNAVFRCSQNIGTVTELHNGKLETADTNLVRVVIGCDAMQDKHDETKTYRKRFIVTTYPITDDDTVWRPFDAVDETINNYEFKKCVRECPAKGIVAMSRMSEHTASFNYSPDHDDAYVRDVLEPGDMFTIKDGQFKYRNARGIGLPIPFHPELLDKPMFNFVYRSAKKLQEITDDLCTPKVEPVPKRKPPQRLDNLKVELVDVKIEDVKSKTAKAEECEL